MSGVLFSVKTSTQKSGVFSIILAMVFWLSVDPLSRKSFTITRRFSAKNGIACRFVPKAFGSSVLASIVSMFMSPECFFSNSFIQKLTFLVREKLSAP